MDLQTIKDIANIIFWLASPIALGFGLKNYNKDNSYKLKWDKAKFTKDTVDGLVKNEKTILATYMLGGYEHKKYQIQKMDKFRHITLINKM